MMMMVTLHFDGNVHGFYDRFCVEVCVMLHGNMNTNPRQRKINCSLFHLFVQMGSTIPRHIAYFDELPTVSLAKNAIKSMVTAIQVKICK